MNRVIWAIRSISIATMASFNVKEALNFASSIFKLNFVFEFHVIFWVRWIVIKLICHRVLSHLNWFSGDTFGSKVKYFEHFAVCVNEKIHASNKSSKSLPNLSLNLFWRSFIWSGRLVILSWLSIVTKCILFGVITSPL